MLALLGKRVPSSLKLLLTTIAIVDDLGAVAIIALAYTDGIDVAAAGAARRRRWRRCTSLNRRGVAALWPYLVGSARAVAARAAIGRPRDDRRGDRGDADPGHALARRARRATSPLHRLEHALHPVGRVRDRAAVRLRQCRRRARRNRWRLLAEPLVLGIAAGLFFGKQIGIFGSIWLAVRLGIARAAGRATWVQLYGMALLAGIGFTMSLFIGGLAFPATRVLVERGQDRRAGGVDRFGAGGVSRCCAGAGRNRDATASSSPPAGSRAGARTAQRRLHRLCRNAGARRGDPARRSAGRSSPRIVAKSPIRAVHDAGYVAFLKDAPGCGARRGGRGMRSPMCFRWWGAAAAARPDRRADGALCVRRDDADHARDLGRAPIGARRSALAATHAVLDGERAAFALCRPPGHHAGADYCGGYCHLNVAAIAAQAARDAGVANVAILDIDYHHGNGTQDIFWTRGDVFYASIHADPATDYPFYWGHADEIGEGEGEGATLNLPLPHGTRLDGFRAAQAARAGGDRTVRRGTAGGELRRGHLGGRSDLSFRADDGGLCRARGGYRGGAGCRR